MEGQLNTYWVGIDVSKSKFDVALCRDATAPQDWRRLEARSFGSDGKGVAAFAGWLRSMRGGCAGICAESTGVYSMDLARAIAAAAPELPALAIVNPARVKAAARVLGARDKSDAVDARIIATFAAWKRPEPRPPRAPSWERLRALFNAREAVVAQRDAFANRVEDSRDSECLKAFRRIARQFGREVVRLDAAIAETIEGDPVLARQEGLLRSVPCIGPVGATAILAHFGDLGDWSRGQVVASAGLYPRVHESGSSVRGKPRLAKGGGGIVRKKLFLGAVRLLRNDYGFNRTALRMRGKNRPPMVCLGAGMRKLLLVARAVVVSGVPYDPNRAARA